MSKGKQKTIMALAIVVVLRFFFAFKLMSHTICGTGIFAYI